MVLVLVFIVVVTVQRSISSAAAFAPEDSLAMAVAGFCSAVGCRGFAVVGVETLRDGDLSGPISKQEDNATRHAQVS